MLNEKKHDCNTYIDAVKTYLIISEMSHDDREKYWVSAVECHVDVEILKDNETISKIVNYEVFICNDNICIEVEGDRKFFVLPDYDSYKVRISATDDGQMSFYLIDYDGTNEYIKTYSDIDIKEGDCFVAEISNPENPNNTELKYESNKINNLQVNNIVYCVWCGAELKETQHFCHICG